MEKVAKEMGRVLTRLRKDKGLSQEALADLAQIHRTYVSQIERGLKYPTVYVLFQISDALDIKLSDIILEIEKSIK